MHELSVAQNIIEIAESYFDGDSNCSIRSIKIELGEFCNIMSEPLVFSFDVMKEESRLKNAVLLIDEIPLILTCKDCGSISVPHEPAFFCSVCSSLNIEVQSGMEMKILEIEFID